MNLDLTGKRALVCGSTQGIGRASAMELALLGASITLVARNEEKLKETIRSLPADDTESHHYVVADFTDPEQLKTAVDTYLKRHTIDILVNNTGGPAGGQAIEASIEEYSKAFSQHLICNQILAQAVLPNMKQVGWGRIINVISTFRAAVANWAKTLSFELGGLGITVNNVLPSTSMTGRLESLIKSRAEKEGRSTDEVEQDMVKEIPAGRIGTAEDVAAAVAFLASPAAGYINGINIPVDGGRTPNL